MKEVLINIKGTQGLDDNTEVIELTTVGKMGFKDGMVMLSYEESELSGAKGIKTNLRVKNSDTVILQRSGEMTSRLVVEKNVRNSCFYSTGFGEMVIGIYGEGIENNLTPSGGTLKMTYTIDSNLQLISRNIVEITVKEVEKDV